MCILSVNTLSEYIVCLCLLAVLCADRVGQMTKTYSDIDAVTRLLEEVRMQREKCNPLIRTSKALCRFMRLAEFKGGLIGHHKTRFLAADIQMFLVVQLLCDG